MDTAKTDQIERGTVIKAVSVRHNSKGALRVEYGPLAIAWSDYDGGWVSVVTSKGDTAFEVCEYQDSEEQEEEDGDSEEEVQVELVEHITDEKAAKPTKEQEAEEAEASGSGGTHRVDKDGVLRDEHGFEVDAERALPILHSNRNKVDPAYGEDTAVFTGATTTTFLS